MTSYVVIRRARAEDEAARAALLRDAAHEHFAVAFLMFFFQELTLQFMVLSGAVLFIFCGASVAACGAVVPVAAGAVAAGVRLAHWHAGERAAGALRGELAGWVAEARAPPPRLGGPAPPALPVYTEAELRRRDDARAEELGARLVGTVSLCECWGPEPRGWLQALAVARGWRRRGAARALAGAAAGAARAAGLHSLEAVTSGVQHAGRATLHAAGWALRATYRRPLLYGALSLPMAQLNMELPGA